MADLSTSWSPSRFLQTLGYFRVVPFLGDFNWLFPQPPLTTQIDRQQEQPMIFDFRQPDQNMQQIWGAVDDVVMGGVSESSFYLANDVALFAGNVSIANSGGFASVRTRNLNPPLDLSGYDGVDLRVKGDGQRYKFILRDSAQWDGPSYALSFDTVYNIWMTVRIPFADLRANFRAKTVTDAPPLDTTKISSLQLMLSKFEYDRELNPRFNPGTFQLQLETIQAYKAV
ncbi:MAG: CIA30 family protein [Cyanobacteria bacterium P01_H01_bin.121]